MPPKPTKLVTLQDQLARLNTLEHLKKQLREIDDELAYRKKHWSICYYQVRPDGTTPGPHSQQAAFHADPSVIRIASGGNRSGKSACGINEDVAHSLGYRPWLSPDDPNYKIKIRVPNKGLILSESFGEQVKKVIVPKLLGNPENNIPGALPSELIAKTKSNPQGIITYIALKNGSEIWLQSYDQHPDLFQSADYDWAHFDEPPPRVIWVYVQRGLTDRRGRSWITMTPLKEAWLFDEIYSRSDVGLFYFDIQDNLNYGLSQEGIDQFARSLTDDEKESMLHGRYFHLTGLVYKTYSAVHRIPRRTVPHHWAMWFHVDTHPRTPHHAVYLAVDPQQRFYVCGAIRNQDPTNRVGPFLEALRVYERARLAYPPHQINRLIDPSARIPNPAQEGRSIFDAFAEGNFFCRSGSKNRDAGILLLQQNLQHDPAQGVYPNIFFFDDLDNVHFEMTHYVWDDWANKKISADRTQKQVPKDANDHFIEGIHRILLDSPQCDLHDSLGSADEDALAVAASGAGASSVTGY